MRLLLLAEGDAERWDSWSGSTKSVVDQLRAVGHDVATFDVDLYGPARWMVAARTVSPDRRRWGVRYHLANPGFRARSRHAERAIAEHSGRLDCVLQIGATFGPSARLPYAVFCDSNIVMSLEGSAFGVSEIGRAHV